MLTQLEALNDADRHVRGQFVHRTFVGPPVWGMGERTLWLGYCDCGWVGHEAADERMADLEAQAHVVAIGQAGL
jgi:hypothetical protein